jgi:hypothetical protein
VTDRGDPVHDRHPQVHQHHVGLLPADRRHPFRPVVGLADDLDVARRAQNRAQVRADHWLVVDDHDPDHAAGSAVRT